MKSINEGPISNIATGFASIAKKYATDPNFRKNVNMAVQSGSKVFGRILSNNEKSMLNEINKKAGIVKPKAPSIVNIKQGIDTVQIFWNKSNGLKADISCNPLKENNMWIVIKVNGTINFKIKDKIQFDGTPDAGKPLKVFNHAQKTTVTIPKVDLVMAQSESINPMVDKIVEAEADDNNEADDSELLEKKSDDKSLEKKVDDSDIIDAEVIDDTKPLEKKPIEPVSLTKSSDENDEPTKIPEKIVESVYVDQANIRSLFENIRYF